MPDDGAKRADLAVPRRGLARARTDAEVQTLIQLQSYDENDGTFQARVLRDNLCLEPLEIPALACSLPNEQ